MNIEQVQKLILYLDVALTGRTYGTVIHTMEGQQVKVNALADGVMLDYHLSDSGYSRLDIDPLEGTVHLTSNSTDKAKSVWSQVGVQAMIKKLQTEITIRHESNTQL